MVVDSCHNSGDQGHGVASPYFSNESHSAFVGKSMPLFLYLHLVLTFLLRTLGVAFADVLTVRVYHVNAYMDFPFRCINDLHIGCAADETRTRTHHQYY